MVLDLSADDRQSPLLLFDATDAGNLGWFSRCHFYVDGASGAVLQTPITIANQRDRSGHTTAQRGPHSDQQGTADKLPPSQPAPR